jgi:hypothetical protein
MFMYDDANPEITRPRIKDESTSDLPGIKDRPTNNLPSLPVSSEFPGVPSAPMNFPGLPTIPGNFPGLPAIPGNFPGVPASVTKPGLNTTGGMTKPGLNTTGGMTKTISEIEAETRSRRDQKYFTSPLAPLNRTTGKKFESSEQIDSEMTKALALGAINPEQKEYFNVLKNFKQNLNPVGGTSGRQAMFMYDDMNPEVTQPRINQALQSNQQPAAAAQQSFTQQEAAFSNNTSALTTLAGGIESLNSTLSNFEANFGNLNNVPGAQPAGAQAQAGAQPGATTTTNAPVSVIVNAQGSNDIATAVGEEIEKSIPTIINKVRAALGPPFNKVPPQVPS